MSDETTVKQSLPEAADEMVKSVDAGVADLRTHSAAAAGPGTMIHDVLHRLDKAAAKLKEALHHHAETPVVVPKAVPPAVSTAPAKPVDPVPLGAQTSATGNSAAEKQ